jgi:hypothetical protein
MPVNPSIPSGPYSATWAGSSIGLFEGPVRLQQNVIGLPVRASQWGQTVIDYIMQGGGAFGVVTVKEWTAAIRTFLWPFGSTMGIVDEPGILFSQYCQPLVLTALAGTPAATHGPVTRTYHYCATLPGHNLDITFGPMERNIVVAVGVLPEPATGGSRKAKFFTDS